MRRLSRTVALTLGTLTILAPTIADAAPATKAARGWQVQRVRFQPVDDRAAPLTVNGVGTYRGSVEVVPGGTVVNEVALEDYVKGIAEVPASWPAEAQKAQAIAARTYALHQMARMKSGPITTWRAAGAHICATQDCQVYAGVEKEKRSPAWAQAVEATRGQAIVWRDGPILAMYSSSNGGHSMPGSQPYLRPVSDPDDSASPLHRWRFALPLPQVGAAFAMPGETFDVGRAGDQIILTSRLEDGTQHQTSMPVADFRARVNATIPSPNGLPRTIPSVRVTVSTNGDGVVVDGRGYGHGVGMSQYGALGKAIRGLKAPDILASYYGGLRPVALPQPPQTIRVAVAMGRGETRVTSAGRFRVLDQDGRPIAILTGGTWTVVNGGRGVRVVPPAGADDPLILSPVGLERGGLKVRLNLTTDVQATVDGVPQPSQILDPGDRLVPLPPLAPGPHVVLLAADAGAGRTAAIEHRFDVPDPNALPKQLAAAPQPPGVTPLVKPAAADSPWPAAIVATILAAAVATAGLTYRSRSSRNRSS